VAAGGPVAAAPSATASSAGQGKQEEPSPGDASDL